MKRISFSSLLLFCLGLSLPFGPMANFVHAEEPDLLNSEGQINTDILNPPQIERKVEDKLEQKIERQFQKRVAEIKPTTQEPASPFTPKAQIPSRNPSTVKAPTTKITLPPTIVKSAAHANTQTKMHSKTSTHAYQGF